MPKLEVVSVQPLLKMGAGRRIFLTANQIRYNNNGKEASYYFISRGDNSVIATPDTKRPDAVVIVAFVMKDGERHLLLTKEYRMPIGGYELSFPAGLIDDSDGDITTAAQKAAERECREETGMDFIVKEVSPLLYSSAGLTDESIVLVFGEATGTISDEGLEHTEDITAHLYNLEAIRQLVANPDPKVALSKVAYPFLWSFAKYGFPA